MNIDLDQENLPQARNEIKELRATSKTLKPVDKLIQINVEDLSRKLQKIEKIVQRPTINKQERAVVEKMRNKLNKLEKLNSNEMRVKRTTQVEKGMFYIIKRANNNQRQV